MGIPRRALAAVMALTTVTVLGACGGDNGPPLSRAAFTKKANAECDSLRRASDDFHNAQQPGASGQEVATSLHDAAALLRQLVGNVERLVPPDAIAGEVDTLLGVLADYADGLDTLASRTKANQTFQNVLDDNVRIVNRLNTLAGRAGQIVVNLRLTKCAPPA